MNIASKINGSLLNLAGMIETYAKVRSMNPGDALRAKGARLAFLISSKLRRLKPDRAKIEADVESHLRSGRGISIRKSVRDAVPGKRQFRSMNRGWELVQREINQRVRGRGFLGYGTGLRAAEVRQGQADRRGRAGQLLSTSTLQDTAQLSRLQFTFGSERTSLGEALQDSRIAPHVQAAINETAADMETYLLRKEDEAFAKNFAG